MRTRTASARMAWLEARAMKRLGSYNPTAEPKPDPDKETAADLFGLPVDEITDAQRQIGKRFNAWAWYTNRLPAGSIKRKPGQPGQAE